jgi:hypothetical protein
MTQNSEHYLSGEGVGKKLPSYMAEAFAVTQCLQGSLHAEYW